MQVYGYMLHAYQKVGNRMVVCKGYTVAHSAELCCTGVQGKVLRTRAYHNSLELQTAEYIYTITPMLTGCAHHLGMRAYPFRWR